MAGISEALVATAVGLAVAIPAVVAFNVFNRGLKTRDRAHRRAGARPGAAAAAEAEAPATRPARAVARR